MSMIIAESGAGLGDTDDARMAQKRRIGLLQKYLRRAGARDARGVLPHETGAINASTVQAFNALQTARGLPPVTAEELLLNPEEAAVRVSEMIPAT